MYDDFAAALRQRGLLIDTGDIAADGAFHRVAVVTARNHVRKNGWYILWNDGDRAVGCYGRHDDGLGKEIWSSKEQDDLTREDRMVRQQQWQRDARHKRAQRFRRTVEAADVARKLWDKGRESFRHPYLLRKHVRAYGIRMIGACQLLIPMYDADGQIQSLQMIDENGRKVYLKHGRKAGCFHQLGSPTESLMIGLAEGYATAASLHEVLGIPMTVSFDAENLGPVARVLRDLAPKTRLVIFADDDWKTDGNPGVTKAQAAAEPVQAEIVIPKFPGRRAAGDTDFNDLASRVGANVLRRIVREQLSPQKRKHAA